LDKEYQTADYAIEQMDNFKNRFPNSAVKYSKTWVSNFGIKNNCYARDANELEKKLFESDKKDTK